MKKLLLLLFLIPVLSWADEVLKDSDIENFVKNNKQEMLKRQVVWKQISSTKMAEYYYQDWSIKFLNKDIFLAFLFANYNKNYEGPSGEKSVYYLMQFDCKDINKINSLYVEQFKEINLKSLELHGVYRYETRGDTRNPFIKFGRWKCGI